jgi:hypothetical protein
VGPETVPRPKTYRRSLSTPEIGEPFRKLNLWHEISGRLKVRIVWYHSTPEQSDTVTPTKG